MSGWDELFDATNFAGPVTTRDVSPIRNESSADRFPASGPNMPYDIPDQLSQAPWPTEEFQWQSLNSTYGIAVGPDGQAVYEGSMIGADHGLLDFPADA
jgi:hypothetical protein